MKRHTAIGGAAAVTLLVAGILLYGYVQQPASASAEFDNWTPNAREIQGTIGTAAHPKPGMSDTKRREQFCTLFKDRFRHHDPAIAVGVRFLTPTCVKLMLPPRMEPCFMDQIALSLWRESRANFGSPVDVDLYDTFIGTAQIKIGELRVRPDQPDMAHIVYDFHALDKITRPRHWPTTAAEAASISHNPPRVHQFTGDARAR